jgi:hypothetical protein
MLNTAIFWAIVLPALGTSFILLQIAKSVQKQQAKAKSAKATVTINNQ